MLRRTVIDHESQSALLLGYTGSGKSLVLDRVLRCLAEEAVILAQGRRKGKGKKRSATPDSAVRQGALRLRCRRKNLLRLGERRLSSKTLFKLGDHRQYMCKMAIHKLQLVVTCDWSNYLADNKCLTCHHHQYDRRHHYYNRVPFWHRKSET